MDRFGRRLATAWLAALLCATACGRGDTTTPEAPAVVPPSETEALARIDPGPHDQAVLDMGELGEIRFELLPEIAPKTVTHITALVERGFYDGTYFHRVIPGFMIQGGDPHTKDKDPRNDGKGGTARVDDEFSDYPHLRGTVSMANTGNVDSSSCQFFIVHEDRRSLDGAFTAFGRVVSGMEVVDRIAELEIDTYGRYGPPNRPYPVSATIERMWIEPAEDAAGAAPEALAVTSG